MQWPVSDWVPPPYPLYRLWLICSLSFALKFIQASSPFLPCGPQIFIPVHSDPGFRQGAAVIKKQTSIYIDYKLSWSKQNIRFGSPPFSGKRGGTNGRSLSCIFLTCNSIWRWWLLVGVTKMKEILVSVHFHMSEWKTDGLSMSDLIGFFLTESPA